MKLVLLGTTGYHPNELRHTACMMLPQLGVVFDAGTAMFRVRDHLATPTLDLFLTHGHIDHVIGVTYLLDVLRDREMEHVRIHGAEQVLTAIKENLFSPVIFPVVPPFEFVPIAETVTLCDGAVLTHFPLQHPGGSVGYRVDWPDRSLAYVTDTTARFDADYIERIRGVDVLIHESNFPDGFDREAELTGHSCVSEVAHLAATAEVGLLILVHVTPLLSEPDPFGIDAVRTIFPTTQIGLDNMVVEF